MRKPWEKSLPWLGVVVLALLVGQFFYSRKVTPEPGQVSLQTIPSGARVSAPTATSVGGAHLKFLGYSSAPLPVSLQERRRFTFVLDLWGYEQQTVRLTSEELAAGPVLVTLKPAASFYPLLYVLRDYFPTFLAGLSLLLFGLLRVRPELRARRLQAEMWASGEIVPGMEIHRYRVLRFLGAGASGAVYLVADETGERHYALKVLKSSEASLSERRAELERECRTIKELNHPGIVALFDWGEVNGLFYIVMEYLGGVTLSKVESPSVAKICAWSTQLVEALEYAHGRGLVHRDLKPDNVILDEKGRARLLDFGIAALMEDGDSQAAGTVGFMAPEQVSGKVSPACDYYSLGVTVYRLLSGVMPFQGEDDFQVLGAQSLGRYPSLQELRPELPEELSQLVAELLVQDPEQRLSDGKQVRQRFQSLL